MIDTTYRLETPEGIDLDLGPAGPVVRGLALAIDVAIRQALALALAVGLAQAESLGSGIFLVLYFLLQWFYPVLFEVISSGQTPGKRALGLRVVNQDGTPIGWSASLLRNLLRTVDFLPFFYLAGIVSMLTTRHFQRLGDLAAGTLVIGVKKAAATSPRHDITGAHLAPVALLADEQRAILGFAERSSELSSERVIELAEILCPLTGRSGRAGADELLRIANGIAGRR